MLAMTSKLNNNLLLLSSKHALTLHNNLYRSKTLQFGLSNLSFSPLKLETLRLNSTTSSRKINNIGLSFHESKGVTINQNHACNPFEVLKQKFDELKSKSASVLIASCLILGLMLIGFQRPALALPWSSPPGQMQIEEIEDVLLKFIGAFVLFLASAVFLLGVILNLQAVHDCLTSILTIQVGLVVEDDVCRDLSLISESFQRYTSNAWKTILEDTIEVLDWHRGKLTFGYSSGKTLFNRKDFFESLSYEERKKFDKGRPINLRNLNAKRMVRRTDKLGNRFVVVTILMELEGWHRLPAMSKRRDLDKVFKKVKSYTSKLIPKGLELVWTPQQEDESFTVDEMKNFYPLLKPLQHEEW